MSCSREEAGWPCKGNDRCECHGRTGKGETLAIIAFVCLFIGWAVVMVLAALRVI